MENFMKYKSIKNKGGITLIALVITIIILLILAGISIGMLSGDNGILGQAGNAKTQTDIAGEKEIIDLAVVHAMGKSKYGDIDETSFTNELEKNNATVTKSGSKYKVAFTSGRQYTVDSDGNVKEKNPNSLEISELYENGSTYFGWDVINYAETLPENLQDTKWQLFYAGALDGETEEKIYLISKGYVKNTQLPTVIKNGIEIAGAKPIAVSGSNYKAIFGNNQSNGVMSQYTGSADIATEMQRYNKDYFLDYTSTNPNMKAVAYMLDTTTWNAFATSTNNYADFAIGGPTIELLFTSYNKYKGTMYESDAVSEKGYNIRKKSSDSFSETLNSAIESDTDTLDNPYSVSNLSVARGYWLGSPSGRYNKLDRILCVQSNGSISFNDYTYNVYGFRPLVCLKSNYTLEKTKDSNNNDAFIIIEQ